MTSRPSQGPAAPSWAPAAALGYAAILAYGTLYPLDQWTSPAGLRWLDLVPSWPRYISRTDLVTNLVVYLPLGVLALWAFRRRYGNALSVVLATAAGGGLSLGLELVQGLLPARVSSLLDLTVNTTGSLCGAGVAAFMSPSLPAGRWLHALRRRWLRPRADANLGLTVFALWALSQLSPLVPSIDLGLIMNGLRPLVATLRNPASFDLQHAAVYALAVCGLALLGVLFFRKSRQRPVLFPAFVYGVLLLKVPILTRQLSLEALVGTTAGLLMYLVARRRASRRSVPIAAATLILSSLVFEGLRALGPAGDDPFQRIAWVPFASYRLNVYDLADILGTAWVGLGLAYAAWHATTRQRQVAVACVGGLLLLVIGGAVEVAQQWLPGRTADISDVLVVLGGWTIPWLRRQLRQPGRAPLLTPRH